MILGKLKLSCCAAIFSLLFGTSVAQSPSRANNAPLARLAESLRSRGIALTKDSLIAALRNPDPEIRSLAARKLAEDQSFDAIPEIEAALLNETIPRARIGMSLALKGLGDPKGAENLQSMCVDSSLKIGSIVELVQTLHLVALPSNACVGLVFSSLSRAQNVDYRADVLSLLPSMYHDLTKEQADRAVHVLEAYLLDEKQQPSVHLQASHSLAEIGLLSSSPAIRTALSRETDPVLRSRFQDDLNILSKKPPAQ